MSFADGYSSIRPSVVGLGVRHNDDEAFEILGSGFVIHENGWVLTNHHVLESLTQNENGTIRVGAAVFFFVHREPPEGCVAEAGIVATNLRDIVIPDRDGCEDRPDPPPNDIRRNLRQVLTGQAPDIGICRIDPGALPEAAIPLQAAAVANSAEIREGDSVGILGFPQGLVVPSVFEDRRDLQMEPILQTGVIAAKLPYSAMEPPDTFVLDIPVNPGSSGSPLFRRDGGVVGVVFATRRQWSPLGTITEDGVSESHDTGVYVPASLGLAIPSARFPMTRIEAMVGAV